jgi:hypothetical protein
VAIGRRRELIGRDNAGRCEPTFSDANGKHLESGKPFDKFSDMRAREILANWLLSVTVNYADKKRFTFCSDPIGGDGIIYHEDTEETWLTEHIMVTRRQTGDAETLILQAIEQKRQKGGSLCQSQNPRSVLP